MVQTLDDYEAISPAFSWRTKYEKILGDPAGDTASQHPHAQRLCRRRDARRDIDIGQSPFQRELYLHGWFIMGNIGQYLQE